MKREDVKCPICGHMNKGLDLEESEGWLECECCGADFAPGKYLPRALQRTVGKDVLDVLIQSFCNTSNRTA